MSEEKQNKLTKKEQASTTAYKLLSQETKRLRESLKIIQDESEKERKERHELDKKVVLLESKLKINWILETFKFLASGGVGFSIAYFTSDSTQLGWSILIPSVIVYIVCAVVNNK